VGQRLGHADLRLAPNADQVLLDDERTQARELRGRACVPIYRRTILGCSGVRIERNRDQGKSDAGRLTNDDFAGHCFSFLAGAARGAAQHIPLAVARQLAVCPCIGQR
jgi:hypothetical protein